MKSVRYSLIKSAWLETVTGNLQQMSCSLQTVDPGVLCCNATALHNSILMHLEFSKEMSPEDADDENERAEFNKI